MPTHSCQRFHREAAVVSRGYLMVFMFEQTRQRLHAGLQRRILRLHLAAETGHHSHGRVQSVLVDEMAAVSDEAQHTIQAASLKHGTRLPSTDQLQHLQPAINQQLSMGQINKLSIDRRY